MKSVNHYLLIGTLSLFIAGCSGISKKDQEVLAINSVSNAIMTETIIETMQIELDEVFQSLDNFWSKNCEYDNSLYIGRGVYITIDDFSDSFDTFKTQTIETLPVIKELLINRELNGDYASMFKGSYTDYKNDDNTYSDLKANHKYYNDEFCEDLITYNYDFCHNKDGDDILKSLACYFDARAILRNGIPEIIDIERVKVKGVPICWKVKARSNGYYYVSIYKDANGEWTGIAHKDTPDFSDLDD